jgi:hypothetical protein
MIFNRWRKYPEVEPEEVDWYLCTLADGRVMTLCYMEVDGGSWIDLRRTDVFDTYDVYDKNFSPCLGRSNRIWDNLCDRTIDVVAWKEMPKPYKPYEFGRKR